MVVKTIYVTRHAFRVAYTLDAVTGQYHTNSPSPTKIPNDVPLVAYGVQQSHELADTIAKLDPSIDYLYSSPFYRCLQTIEPAIPKLKGNVKVRVDNGIGYVDDFFVSEEWYGHSETFLHPSPAPLSLLSTNFFPSLKIHPAYAPSVIPPASGESISQLHDRVAYALSHIIHTIDTETGPEKDTSILLCTHAATLIAIGRCLTGRMPDNTDEEDFVAPCAGLTKFVRRDGVVGRSKIARGVVVNWKDGKGVCGGWDCVMNGNCDHLTGGAERSWHFSGEETFSAFHSGRATKLGSTSDDIAFSGVRNDFHGGKPKI